MVDVVGHSKCATRLRQGPRLMAPVQLPNWCGQAPAEASGSPSSHHILHSSWLSITEAPPHMRAGQALRRSIRKQLQVRTAEKGHYRLFMLIRACWWIQGCDRTWYPHSSHYGQINLIVMENEEQGTYVVEARRVRATAFTGCWYKNNLHSDKTPVSNLSIVLQGFWERNILQFTYTWSQKPSVLWGRPLPLVCWVSNGMRCCGIWEPTH